MRRQQSIQIETDQRFSTKQQANFDKINNEIKLQDLYNKMFLQPLQMKLDQKKGSLPTGLKIVDRKNQLQYDINEIGKEKLLTFIEFQELINKGTPVKNDKGKPFNDYFSYAKANYGDNLLCQMKAHGTPLEMGVCICMYNESREMLQNTLKGVGANIYNLWKQGVDPDKIFVSIIQDGIQPMNKENLTLYQILENQSGIRISSDQNLKFEQKMSKLTKIQSSRTILEIQDQNNVTDINSFLFTPEQLQKRTKNRFINVKKQYEQIKKLQKEVHELKKKKVVTNLDLPVRVLDFYEKFCYEAHTGQPYPNVKLHENGKKIVEQFYNNDLKKSEPFIRSALQKTQIYCNEYITSRQDMAHVSFFRTSLYFPDQRDNYLSVQNSQHRHLLTEQQWHRRLKMNKIFKQSVKMNIFFIVKYQNAQKLSSHNWFFNGFCKQFCDFDKEKGKINQISPKYTILLDVGLVPEQQALVKMYNVMDNHNKIGGVCGYMNLKIQKPTQAESPSRFNLDVITQFCLNFANIQRAQQLEYHFAHLIDKGFESIFKFIHVLPGAFSGYNMEAIWGAKDGDTNADKLLQQYFSSISEKLSSQSYKPVELSLFEVLCRVILPNILIKFFFSREKKGNAQYLMYSSNVNLAEDRILCMGIRQNKKQLLFIPDANSHVDPVKDIPGLLGQRKRWINGSYFAFDKVSDQLRQTEGHFNVLGIQINYLALMNLLAYIAPGFYLFSISVAMEAFKADVLTKFFQDTLTETSQIYGAFVYTINFIYALMIGALVFYSVNLTNKDQKFVRFTYAMSTFLGIMSLIMMTILVVDLIRGLSQSSDQSYLIANSTFTENIPGGRQTINWLRYIMLFITGLYVVPILVYSILFKTARVLIEIISGAISFIFYQPTYLIILSTYALCRMDDLSWGTKGLQSGGSQTKDISNVWSKIKIIHVGKFVFWNIIVAGLLIHFGSNYLIRFWLTFALMILIGGTMFIKVLLSFIYYLYYVCFINSNPKTVLTAQPTPCLYKNFDEDELKGKTLGSSLRQVIKSNVAILSKNEDGQMTNSILAMQLLAMMGKKKTNNNSKILINDGFKLLVSGINKMVQQNQQNKKSQEKKFKKNLNVIKEVNEDEKDANEVTSNSFLNGIPSPQKKNILPKRLDPLDKNFKRPFQL